MTRRAYSAPEVRDGLGGARYLVMPQWYYWSRDLRDVFDPARRPANAQACDAAVGALPHVFLRVFEPPTLLVGDVLFLVRRDGSMRLLRTNYDSSG